MSDPELAPYHRWTPRQRWWFDTVLQLICVGMLAAWVWQCTGPPGPPPEPCPPTVTK